MTRTGPPLCVAILERTAFIKVPGRATFASSHELKNLVTELRQRGFADFVLDLHECVTMDSTFLGVLAGLVLRNNQAAPEAPHIELLNPNARVHELIENLGVLDLFEVKTEAVPSTVIFEPTAAGMEATREQITRTCLEAHRTLMDANPENIPKFKEVTQFMAEDLKKLTESKPGNS